MRDPKRIDRILKKLKKAWEQSPDLRLCQLITIKAASVNPHNHPDLFYVEDEDLEKKL